MVLRGLQGHSQGFSDVNSCPPSHFSAGNAGRENFSHSPAPICALSFGKPRWEPAEENAASIARHAEVAERYAWAERDRRRRRCSPDRLMAINRVREVRKVLAARYGEVLPDDDAGRDDLAVLVNYLVQVNRTDLLAKTQSSAGAVTTKSSAGAATTRSKAAVAKTPSKAAVAKTPSKAVVAKTTSKAVVAKTPSKAVVAKTTS
jgi:glutathione synthase/RimK-type ligase-like ATP-grasp enzyme